MKVRLLPVLLTFLISAGLLFGGWFTYQSVAVENPINDMIDSVAGIEDASIELDRDLLLIRVRLTDEAELSTLYHSLLEQSYAIVSDRTVRLEIVDESTEALNRIWQAVLFDVAEAMDSQRYSSIPKRMQELADETPGLKAETAMDERNVYITLKHDGAAKYVVLPRNPARLGVWPVEQV